MPKKRKKSKEPKKQNSSIPTKVMVFWTFDVLHPGHVYYFEQAKQYGHELIVVVARDETVQNIKWKSPRNPQKVRAQAVLDVDIVDKVSLGSTTDPYDVLLEFKPDVLCFGYDQKSFNGPGLQSFLDTHNMRPNIENIDAYEPERWKSSKM